VLDAVETLGLDTDGRLLALNSYENRVYQVGLDGSPPVIVKFYRPGRWSDGAILEEHDFSRELADREIPAVPPAIFGDRTLHQHRGFRFSVTPCRGGRTPEMDGPGVLAWIRRLLGCMHAIGELRPFQQRPTLDIASFGEEPRAYLLANGWLPADLEDTYRNVSEHALAAVRDYFERAAEFRRLRLHSDCHPGNMLWTDEGPHFVDFDDTRMGPAIQDLWMLSLSARRVMSPSPGYPTGRQRAQRSKECAGSGSRMEQVHSAALPATS
jgi:Ser/Thr protein kinase RdoA (MazF antagonist)